MTDIITPGPGQTVISTHDHDRHRRHGDHDMVDLIAHEQSAGFRSAAVDSQTTMRDIKDARHDLSQSIGSGVRSLSGQLCGVSKDVLGGQSVGFSAVQKSICEVDYHALGGFKDAAAQAAEVEGRALLEAAKNAAALQVQATANFNALNVEATKNFYALSVEAVKNASAAELRAQQIAAAASAQLAECCCDLKELIRSEGAATRQQASEYRIQDLQDTIAELRRCAPCCGDDRRGGPGNGNN